MHEAFDLVGYANESVHRLAVANARKLQGQREAEIGNERERMRRVDRQRRQNRKYGGKELLLKPRMLLLADALRIDDHDAIGRQFLAQIAPARLLIVSKHRN